MDKQTVATLDDQAAKDEADRILGISPEQRRVFDAVSEFRCACDELVLAENGSSSQGDVLQQMVYSSALSVFGSSWVTDWVRHAMAGAAMGVYNAYDADLTRAAQQVSHEQHQADGIKHDDDCEICIRIEELAYSV